MSDVSDLALRPSKEYPRVPYYLSGPLVTLLIGVSAILGSITLGAIMFLFIDAKFCGTNASTHSVALSTTIAFSTNGLTSLLYQKETPTYDGGHDNIVLSAPNTEAFKPKGSFHFAMLLNYTSYTNANRHTSLVSFNITGDGTSSANNSRGSVTGDTVILQISNPNRKRMHITEPWFDYGYWAHVNQDQLIDKSNIPVWLVDMREAARGRQGGRICATNYDAELTISNKLFMIDPLIVREFAGENIRFSNIVTRGDIIFDLAPHVWTGKLNIHMLDADIARVYLNKPPKTIKVVIYDRVSFFSMVIPFEDAHSHLIYRTIYKSPNTTAYIQPFIRLEYQPTVKIEIAADSLPTDQVFCHNEFDGSLTFIIAESTLSKIILIIEPVGRGACVCEGSIVGQCTAKNID